MTVGERYRQSIFDMLKEFLPDDEWEGLRDNLKELNAVELSVLYTNVKETRDYIKKCERRNRGHVR